MNALWEFEVLPVRLRCEVVTCGDALGDKSLVSNPYRLRTA